MKTYKTAITVWDGKSIDVSPQLKALTDIGFVCDPVPLDNTKDAARIIEALADYDYVIAGSEAFNETTLPFLPKLKLIVRFGVGYDSVDLACAAREGVAVGNYPGINAPSVAEHAIGMMLALSRDFYRMTQMIKEGRYNTHCMLDSLDGTVGLIGFGAIAKKLAHYLSVFDVKVIACDPFVSAEDMAALGVEKTDMDKLIEESDFISLHLPCMKETERIVNKDFLARMKKSAFLINCARGKLIDEDALCDALESGEIRGAALDVYATEPLPDDSRIRKQDRVLLTPHNSPSSWRCYRDVMAACANDVRAFHEGRPIYSLLDKGYEENAAKRQ